MCNLTPGAVGRPPGDESVSLSQRSWSWRCDSSGSAGEKDKNASNINAQRESRPTRGSRGNATHTHVGHFVQAPAINGRVNY